MYLGDYPEEIEKNFISISKDLIFFPEQDEIIFFPGGIALVDIDGPLTEDDLGEVCDHDLLCG